MCLGGSTPRNLEVFFLSKSSTSDFVPMSVQRLCSFMTVLAITHGVLSLDVIAAPLNDLNRALRVCYRADALFDLVYSQHLIGMTRKEICALLGRPSFVQRAAAEFRGVSVILAGPPIVHLPDENDVLTEDSDAYQIIHSMCSRANVDYFEIAF